MIDVWKVAAPGFMLLAMFGAAGQAQADTMLSPSKPAVGIVVGTVYQYGDTTFTFSDCLSCANLELVALKNGRGGTEIEVEEKPTRASYIFSNTTGGFPNPGDMSLRFKVSVGVLAGNPGVSSVSNILLGSGIVTAGGAPTTRYNKDVTSVLSTFSMSGVQGSQTSDLTTTLSKSTFSPVTSGQSFFFTDTLTDNSGTPGPGYTLQLTNVKLLLNPAPEPASIALFATGLLGLTAVRRRFFQRARR